MQTPPADDYRDLALRELARRALEEKCRYYVPNGKAASFLDLLRGFEPGKDGIRIVILRAGNSHGKSALATLTAGYISEPFPNPWFNAIDTLQAFSRPCRGRIYTTPNAAATTYQDEIKKWLPRSRYTATREGRTYDKHFKFKNRSEFDIFTFEQDPEEGESVTLNWAIVDEPMSRNHWNALVSRFRFGGLILFFLTPLHGAGWYNDEFETPERLGKDVFVIQAHTEDACVEHGIRGHLPHSYIESLKRNIDPDEASARLDGSYLSLSGLVYKTYDQAVHFLPELPEYHAECFDQGKYTLYNVIDPHDRKPFAIGWYAVFPNEDIFTVAEWPPYDFHKVTNSDIQVPEYARIIKATEKDLEHISEVRLIDPNFGKAHKLGGKSVQELFADEGLTYFEPPDAIHDGHVAVKKLLGDPRKNIHPQLRILQHCKNHDFAMRRYAWKENKDESKGISETPELVNKDFADLPRYLALYGPRYLGDVQEVHRLYKRRGRTA